MLTRTIFIFAIMILSFGCQSSPNGPSTGKQTITGNVFEYIQGQSLTGHPVAGAKVYMTGAFEWTDPIAVTDEKGRFEFEIAISAITDATLYATKDGYQEMREPVQLTVPEGTRDIGPVRVIIGPGPPAQNFFVFIIKE